MSEYVAALLDEPRKFAKDSIQLLNRCTKPDRREYLKISQAVAIGFAFMGMIGYVIQLVHIPIRNIIVGI